MEKIEDLSLDQKAKLYYMGLVRKGEIDTLPEDPKAAFVRDMMDKEKPQKEDKLKEKATELGYLEEVDGMEGGQTNQYEKVAFIYSEQGGRFYGLDVYENKDQDQRSNKLGYYEANGWLKNTLESFEGVKTKGIDDLIPKGYNSGMGDLDLIVRDLRELGIEASHNEYDFS